MQASNSNIPISCPLLAEKATTLASHLLKCINGLEELAFSKSYNQSKFCSKWHCHICKCVKNDFLNEKKITSGYYVSDLIIINPQHACAKGLLWSLFCLFVCLWLISKMTEFKDALIGIWPCAREKAK